MKFEEGEKCPDQKCNGTLEFPPVEARRVPIVRAILTCTSLELECSECGITEDEWLAETAQALYREVLQHPMPLVPSPPVRVLTKHGTSCGKTTDDEFVVIYDDVIAADPNGDMIDADESDYNREEFEEILRRHIKPTAAPQPEPEDTAGADLARAIERTVSGAAHPQAMWRAR